VARRHEEDAAAGGDGWRDAAVEGGGACREGERGQPKDRQEEKEGSAARVAATATATATATAATATAAAAAAAAASLALCASGVLLKRRSVLPGIRGCKARGDFSKNIGRAEDA
jgi:hypothetical protein